MNITIRKAIPNDWTIIQKLNTEVFVDNAKYDPYIKVNWPFLKSVITYFKETTSKKKYMTLIAEVDSKPVGYIVGTERKYSYRNIKIAEIDNMGVTPQFRSKGIGRELMQHFIRWAKSKGFDTLYVNAYFANKRGIEFYQSMSMKPIDMSLEMEI